jgi:signal transduction histidine kinase
MLSAPIPTNEAARLTALQRYAILDTPATPEFDDFTALASEICGTPIALISLIDTDRQWFKSKVGLDASQTPRDISFCGHAIHGADLFEVTNALEDERFRDNPLVTNAPDMRFYAGQPLISSDGHSIGTLCVIDRVVNRLNTTQRNMLKVLSRLIVQQMELRLAMLREQQFNQQLNAQISERQNIERSKSEFISVVSHELRTPLTSIRASLGLLEAGVLGDLPEKAREIVKIANRNSQRLITLVNDILDMDKLVSGKMTIHFERVDVADLVRQSLEANEGYARNYQVTYALTDHATKKEVMTDIGRLTQVMANMLSNAAKFSPPIGVVEIRLSNSGRKIKVEVEDRGAGIPLEFQPRIFGKFAQANHGNTRHQGGTGLGLNISHMLMEKMRGKIGFTTEPGKGTIFWITLPLAVD